MGVCIVEPDGRHILWRRAVLTRLTGLSIVQGCFILHWQTVMKRVELVDRMTDSCTALCAFQDLSYCRPSLYACINILVHQIVIELFWATHDNQVSFCENVSIINKLILNDWTLYPIAKDEPIHPSEKANFRHLYPRSHSVSLKEPAIIVLTKRSGWLTDLWRFSTTFRTQEFTSIGYQLKF